MQRNIVFGNYLRELIKAAKMTQQEFYTAVGITKPYFYDILGGRIKPPPHRVQFKMVEVLDIEGDERIKFFDVAAMERGDIPADISKWVSKNPKAVSNIRKAMAV